MRTTDVLSLEDVKDEVSSPSLDLPIHDSRTEIDSSIEVHKEELKKAYYFLQETLEKSRYLDLKNFHDQLYIIWKKEPWKHIVSQELKDKILLYFATIFKAAKQAIDDPSCENLNRMQARIQEINVAPVSEQIAIIPYNSMFQKLESTIRKHIQQIKYDNAFNELEELTKEKNTPLKVLGADVLSVVKDAKASRLNRITLPELTSTLKIAKNTINNPTAHFDECIKQANRVNKSTWGQIGRAITGVLMILGGFALAVATAITPFKIFGVPVGDTILNLGIGYLGSMSLGSGGSFMLFNSMKKMNPVAEKLDLLGQEARIRGM